MKIAFLVGEFPTLSETFILNQIIGLIEMGYTVDIYASIRRNDPKVHPDVEKYDLLSRTYYATPIPKNRFLRVLKAIKLFLSNFFKAPQVILKASNVIKHNKHLGPFTLLFAVIPWLQKGLFYDIVHCHFGWNGLIGTGLKDIGAIRGKLVTTFHGMDVNVTPRQHGADVYKQVFQKGDLFTVNTEFTKHKTIALGCPPKQLIKLPVGFEISQYEFCERKLDAGKPVTVITVARLAEKKGIEYGIKAIAKVVKRYPNIIYKIVGGGILKASLEQLISDLRISENVRLLGWMTQEQVRQLYTDSHIFMLPSVTAANGDQEGQALVLQEAQAIGLPVLSTWHNGIPEGLLDGVSGFLVPERDVDELANKLIYFVEHPEVWVQMGRAGRAYVEERYDIKMLNKQLVTRYKQLLT